MRVRMRLLACVLLPALLAGCSARQQEGAPVQEEVQVSDSAAQDATRPPKGNKPELVVALPSDITGLNPMTSSGGYNDNCLQLTHETLFRKDDNGVLRAHLAVGGVWTDDVTYELTIRGDVHFSDGSPMTSNDIAHTIRTAKDLHHGAIAPLVMDIESVEPVAVDRVIFHMTSHADDLEERLSGYTFAIQSEAAYETGMQNPYLIGTGRYVFADRVNGRYTTFKRNDIYWGTDPGVSGRISFYAMPDEEARILALKTGSVDVALLAHSVALDALSDETDIRIYEPQWAEDRIVYRSNVVIPQMHETLVQPWGDIYVVLE